MTSENVQGRLALLYPLVIILTHKRGLGLAVCTGAESGVTHSFCVEQMTAEHLCASYHQLLQAVGLASEQIRTLAVGAGPGSFTGLRLGCAFANGLSLGSSCHLVAVSTAPREGSGEDLDYTSFVVPADIELAYERVQSGNFTPTNMLVPNYGREPGPVLLKMGLQGPAKSPLAGVSVPMGRTEGST